MKFLALTIFSIVIFDVAYGLKCKSDSACLTETQMGRGWGGFFKNQENAPCLAGVVGGSDLWCFNSKGGSLKPCTCWDDTQTYDNKWCNTGLFGEKNTMCIYEEGPVASCGDVKVVGISDQAVKDAIVDKHNELRSTVAKGKEKQGADGAQPKAANMRKMVWNDELAEVAQRWVDQCTDGHDENRKTETYGHVGQNWAWTSNWKKEDQADLARKMIGMWYGEVKDMTRTAVKSFSSNAGTGVIGHYTQVVWADSHEVGCGFMTSVKSRNFENVLVCNYGPGGNWRGKPIYQQGRPGSKCPSGTRKTSDGLCA